MYLAESDLVYTLRNDTELGVVQDKVLVYVCNLTS